ILSANQVLRGEGGVFPPGRDPEEMLDGSAVQTGLQGVGNAVDIVSGTGSHDPRLGIMLTDGADCRIVPPDDGNAIGQSGEGPDGPKSGHTDYPISTPTQSRQAQYVV